MLGERPSCAVLLACLLGAGGLVWGAWQEFRLREAEQRIGRVERLLQERVVQVEEFLQAYPDMFFDQVVFLFFL